MSTPGFKLCRYCGRGCHSSCFHRHATQYSCHDVNCRGHSAPRIFQHQRTTPARWEEHEEGYESLERDDWIMAENIDTGERLWFPRDPRLDPIHQQICQQYGPPRPGFRCSYNARGETVAFRVGEGARDYVAPAASPALVRRRGSRRDSNRPSSRRPSKSECDTPSRRPSKIEEGNRPSRRPSRVENERQGPHLRRTDSRRAREARQGNPGLRRESSSRYHDERAARSVPSMRRRVRRKGDPVRPYEIESPSSSSDDEEGAVERRRGPKLLKWDGDDDEEAVVDPVTDWLERY